MSVLFDLLDMTNYCNIDNNDDNDEYFGATLNCSYVQSSEGVTVGLNYEDSSNFNFDCEVEADNLEEAFEVLEEEVIEKITNNCQEDEEQKILEEDYESLLVDYDLLEARCEYLMENNENLRTKLKGLQEDLEEMRVQMKKEQDETAIKDAFTKDMSKYIDAFYDFFFSDDRK